jgi:hypothetical protein
MINKSAFKVSKLEWPVTLTGPLNARTNIKVQDLLKFEMFNKYRRKTMKQKAFSEEMSVR